MSDAKVYFGGLPTKPDVDKIMRSIKAEERRGGVVKHEEIEGLIKVERTENRYKTVCNAWRKKVFTAHGVKIVGDRPDVVGVGFAVLTNKEQIAEAERQYGKGRRRVGAGWKTAALVTEEDLEEADLKRRDHAIQTGVQLFTAHREAQKSLAASTRPQHQHPRLEPPKEAGKEIQ